MIGRRDLTGSVTAADYNALRARAMTEQQLQNVIIAAAKAAGWIVYHTYDSRRSEAGYPDLHLVHAQRGISIFRELKTQKGVVSPAQQKWIGALLAAGQDAAVWRPIDWFEDTISKVLRAEVPTPDWATLTGGADS